MKPGARLFVNGRDRAVILVVVGSEPILSGSRAVGTHHDSPHIDLKARPVYAANGYALFKTIYYGGIKKYQWANRPLALVGRIDTPAGKRIDVSIGPEGRRARLRHPRQRAALGRAAARPDLREGLLGRGARSRRRQRARRRDVGHRGRSSRPSRRDTAIEEEDLVSAELALVPASPPADVGLDRGLTGAFGQDDRLSSYCAARAILDMSGTPRRTALAYLSNFEEVGSVNNTGAASQFLNSTYARLVGAQRGKAYTDLDLRQALRHAEAISADVNDGINPVFPQTSEPSNAARLGFGVTIKQYGAGFDANSEFTAKVRGILDRAGIPWQTQTPRVEGYSGGTIGQYLSSQEMEVIDIGVPLLSMHSPFEMSSKVDVWCFYRFMSAFLGS